jgi:hypothetical protein
MKAHFPILLLLAAALLIAPWATASRQNPPTPAPLSLQALVGEAVSVVYLKYSTSAPSANGIGGTLLSADESGIMLQLSNSRRFVPMHAIQSVSETK